MSDVHIPDTLRDDLRTAWHRYVDMLVPLRPALHGYCRRLAGNIWDAEDLVQDTLVRAFGHWGVTYPAIRDPRAYLLRLDLCEEGRVVIALGDPDRADNVVTHVPGMTAELARFDVSLAELQLARSTGAFPATVP